MPKQNPKPRSLRAQAFEESNYPPNVVGTRCVEVRVPDADEFMAQLAGVIALCGKQFNYQNKDVPRAAAVAAAWRKAYLDTGWGSCMNCDELMACLMPLFEDVLTKLDILQLSSNSIQSGVNNLQYGSGNTQPGVPLSSGALNANQAGTTNPSCNPDITWAQCLQLVQYTNQLIEDALEAAEAATNSTELVQVISAIPGLDELGADAVAGYIALLQDGIQEQYQSEYNQTKEEQIACAIFCLCKPDCSVTISRVNQGINDLLAPYFADLPSTFSTIGAFLSYFVDQNIGSDSVVYVLFSLIWQGGALANLFLGDIGTKALQTLLALAVNDASSDWELLCEDCPEAWAYEWDLQVSESYTSEGHESGSLATWVDGIGYYVVGTDFNYGAIFFDNTRIPAGTDFTAAQFWYSKNGCTLPFNPDWIWILPEAGPYLMSHDPCDDGSGISLRFEGNATLPAGQNLAFGVQVSGTGANVITISKVRLEGYGIRPALTGGVFV